MRSKDDGRPTYRVTFDGCPKGVGTLVESVPGGEVVAWCSCQMPFETHNDPAFQNFSELAAAAVGIAIVGEISSSGGHVELVGDSVTALSWLKKLSFSGYRTRKLALGMLSLMDQRDVGVISTEFILSEANETCDQLSRGII